MVPPDGPGIGVRVKEDMVPGQEKTMKEVAWAAYNNLPEGMEPGLESVDYYDPPNFTYPFGAYVCVVDIDKYTGETTIRRFYALDDCGTRINPMIIEGQIHGGMASAVGQVLGEVMAYDEAGNPLTTTFVDYGLPTTDQLPSFEVEVSGTATSFNTLGFKGVGESGVVGATPAVHNAIVDAVAHLGVEHIDLPCTPERVWAAISAARG